MTGAGSQSHPGALPAPSLGDVGGEGEEVRRCPALPRRQGEDG